MSVLLCWYQQVMQDEGATEAGIVESGISQATLEEVFIRIAEEAELDEDTTAVDGVGDEDEVALVV